MDIDVEPANNEHPEANGEHNNQTSPLSRKHSAVLDQSRTSPLGGAMAPSLTDLARRAPQRSGSGRKNRLFRSNKRMDESEKGREIGLDSARAHIIPIVRTKEWMKVKRAEKSGLTVPALI
jgi:hypothetical protein